MDDRSTSRYPTLDRLVRRGAVELAPTIFTEAARTEPKQDAEPKQGAAVELVADFSGETLKPAITLDRDLLERGELSVRLAFQPKVGQATYLSLTLGDNAPDVLFNIERSYAGSMLDQHADALPKSQSPEETGGKHSTSTQKINDLVRWQQFIDTARALEPQAGSENWWSSLRAKLLEGVDLLYQQNFSLLRDQLRNDRSGATTVRMLFESRSEVLVDLGLRLVALEPSLAAAVQENLAAVSTDRTLERSFRVRASNRLHSAVRILAEEQERDTAA